jgi:hypothetical protein
MDRFEKIEAVDPPTANDSDYKFIYADNELHDILLSGDINKYLHMAKQKQMNLYNIKNIEKQLEQTQETPIEQTNNIYTKTYKQKCIQNIFESIDRLENTLNRFNIISKK